MKSRLAAIAIGVVLTFVVFELFSAGWYALTQGGLFYTAEKAPSVSVAGEVAPGESTKHRLHPYFGFVKISDAERNINNHGFPAAPYDYPFVKQNENQVVIGVFGGSVAAGFVGAGQERLVERLKQNPSFKDKEIVLLNFAQGGYKQPQQLLILSYYLVIGQELDMVVNLDGFNEVALSSRNNGNHLDISMPSTDHIVPLVNMIDRRTLTDDRIEALARMRRTTAQLERIGDRLAQAKLASTWFVLKQIYQIESAHLAQEQVAFQEMATGELDHSMMAIYPPMNTYDDTSLYASIATEWANASIMMDSLLKSRGIPYYHFLQPNQYFSQKSFTEEEKRTALTKDHPYRKGVEPGYPALIAQAQRLGQSGVDFHSAVDIFDQEPGTLYIDDCCHFNEHGNQILADFVADAILKAQGS